MSTDLLPTLEIGSPASPSSTTSPSNANLTARLYSDSLDNQVVHLPQVEPMVGSSRMKLKSVGKERQVKTNKAEVPAPAPIEDNLHLSDSDSDSSCSSYSSSESESGGAHANSGKTEVDSYRSLSTGSASHNSSLETMLDSPPMFTSVSFPDLLPFAASGESRSTKKIKHRVASNLLRHNHHILLHRGQSALNSHIQITVNSKAANEIAAHAVVTEVPALLPKHRQRAQLAALTNLRPLGIPPVSPKSLSVTIPGGHAASPSYRNNTTSLKSPPLSPRGTTLLSPLHATRSPKERKAGAHSAASSPTHTPPSIPRAESSIAPHSPSQHAISSRAHSTNA